MAKFCLTKPTIERFKKALKSREIDPFVMADMTSDQRRSLLERYVGEHAQDVNALFESKLLLKNQKAGYLSWAKRVSGISKEVRRDLFSRIERLDRVLSPTEEKAFLNDLASARLGLEITQDEANIINDFSMKVREKRDKIIEDMPLLSKERIEYGVTQALFKGYVSKLKSDARQISFREEPLRKTADIALNSIPNLVQSILTAYDNSLWLRQLSSVAFTPKYTGIWTKRFLQSWKDIAKELVGQDALILAQADVFSRPNALNGKYDADPSGYGLGVRSEEVYSSDWPAKIPFLGRLYKASSSAFNGGALRVRADIADLEIRLAEQAGLNTLDKKTAAALGSMVTSLTGRGSVGGSESLLRKVFWAPRMYAAQINQMTAHMFDPKATKYTRKLAAKNLVSSLATTSVLFALAKSLDPDSVDEEEHLGKIKIWGKWVDMTGGKASYVRLAMKMSEKILAGLQGKPPAYGESSALEELYRFSEGKASPIASIIRDILKGEMFGGEPITAESMVKSRITPLPAQTAKKLIDDPEASNVLGLMILEGLGASIDTFKPKSYWEASSSQELAQFRKKVGETNFKEANNKFNVQYNAWLSKVQKTDTYKSLSDEEVGKLKTKSKDIIKKRIFKEYGFKPVKNTKTNKKIEALKAK